MALLEKKRVLVIGPDAFTLRHLNDVPDAHRFEFLPVLEHQHILSNNPRSFDQLFLDAERFIAATPKVDGVVAVWDYPATSLAALIAETHGLPGPSLESTIKCEHKYWSRRLQQEVIPQFVPAFEYVDPFDGAAFEKRGLDYPFWLKPIKSAASVLGFRIDNERAWQRAIKRTRERIHIYGDSFAEAIARVSLPAELSELGAHYCIAEQIIGGEQVTLEGYVQRGRVHFHGAIDSIRQSNQSTFSRYQYPSHLDVAVIETMQKASVRLLRHIGYDSGTFNIEFFYDSEASKIWLLEVNPRISQSHAALFQLVDGAPNFSEMVSVAVGEQPPPRAGGGLAAIAAKLFYRTVLEDAVVTAVPSRAEIQAIEETLPGVEIQLKVQVGQRLSDLPSQDSYTYELALMHIGADTEGEILQKYQECVDRLTFAFGSMEDLDATDGHHRVSAPPQLKKEQDSQAESRR